MSSQLGFSSLRTAVAPQAPESPVGSEHGYSITLQVGDRSRKMNYRDAFVTAHDLLKRSKIQAAAILFARLCEVRSAEPRAFILLAVCEARLSRYSAAFEVLNRAEFTDALLAAELYEAILESRMGFKDEAMRKLLLLADAHPQLPTLCLWLGDMHEASGQLDGALHWWKTAIARDKSRSAVAFAASRQVNRLTKPNDTSGKARL